MSGPAIKSGDKIWRQGKCYTVKSAASPEDGSRIDCIDLFGNPHSFPTTEIDEWSAAPPRPSHIWTATIENCCNRSARYELNFPSAWDMDTAFADAKALIAKKYPNRFERFPGPWHPDLHLVELKRGLELTDEIEEAM